MSITPYSGSDEQQQLAAEGKTRCYCTAIIPLGEERCPLCFYKNAFYEEHSARSLLAHNSLYLICAIVGIDPMPRHNAAIIRKIEAHPQREIIEGMVRSFPEDHGFRVAFERHEAKKIDRLASTL